MTLSIVIPAYNHLADVLSCLNSLQAYQQGVAQYIVSDDASPDYLGPAVISPKVAQVVRNAENLGFAGNCNVGAALAQGEIIAFINQDVFAHHDWSHGWDTALVRAFDDPQVGIVGSRLLYVNGVVQSVGGFFDARCQPAHRCLGYSDPHYYETSTAQEVEWVTGAAFAIRRELFHAISGFDTAYRMYFEDVDACLKVRELGYTIRIEPASTLIHKVGQSGGSSHFMESARTFKQRWVDSGRIKPSEYKVAVNFW